MNRLTALTLLAALTVLPGCAGYRLGSMLPPEIRTVHIPTFVNKSPEPQIESDCTRAAIEEIQRDGSLKVAKEEQADAILAVTVTGYQLQPLVYRRDETRSAREYRIVLTASYMMTRRSDGVVLSEGSRVRGEGVFVVAGDLSSSKARGLPIAARDLAHSIIEQVVETWK